MFGRILKQRWNGITGSLVRRRARKRSTDRPLRFEPLEMRRLLVVTGNVSLTEAPEVNAGTGYDGVVSLLMTPSSLCTATLLPTGRHLLTAAHCVTDYDGDATVRGTIDKTSIDVVFDLPAGSKTLTVSDPKNAVHVHYDWPATLYFDRSAHDLAIIDLPELAPSGPTGGSNGLGAERYGIYRSTDELEQTFRSIGYGLTGNGNTGEQPRPPGTTAKKRWGLNHFSDIARWEGRETGYILASDFDDGTAEDNYHNDPYYHVNLESIAAHGDSGGPAFIGNEIAGVAGSWRDRNDDDVTANFGDENWFARVSQYTVWIDQMLAGSYDLVFDLNHQFRPSTAGADQIEVRRYGSGVEIRVNGYRYHVDAIDNINSLRIVGSSSAEDFHISGDLGLDVTLADTSSFSDTLSIVYSDGSDNVSVSRRGSDLEIHAHMRDVVVENGDIDSVTLDLMDGSDVLFVYDTFGRDFTVYGGGAQDFLDAREVSSGRVTLYGDAGNDQLFGGSLGDTLYGGADNDVLHGGGGSDDLDGGAGEDTVVQRTDSQQELRDDRLTGLGYDDLTDIEIANLTGSSTANTFLVTGWTGTAWINGQGGSDRLVVEQDTAWIGLNSDSHPSMAADDGLLLEVSGMEDIELTGGSSDNEFYVGDWTGTPTIDGGGGFDYLKSEAEGTAVLQEGLLIRPDISDLAFSNFEAVGGGRIDVTDYAGSLTLRYCDAVIEKDADVTVSNDLWTFSDGTSFRLEDCSVTLTGGPGDNRFDLSGLAGSWWGRSTLDGAGGNDSVIIEEDTDFTLGADSLTMSPDNLVALVDIDRIELTGGPRINYFTLNDWPGEVTLNGLGGTEDRVNFHRDSDMSLSDDWLIPSEGHPIGLIGIEGVELTGGNNDNLFDLVGWTGTAFLDGSYGNNSLIYQRDAASFHLLNNTEQPQDSAYVGTSDGALVARRFQNVELAGGPGDNLFAMYDWVFEATIDGLEGTDQVAFLYNDDITLSDDWLISPGRSPIALIGIEDARLTGSIGHQRFDLTGWTGPATIDGGGGFDHLESSVGGTLVLQDGWLSRPDAGDLAFSNIEAFGGERFEVTGFTGSATLRDGVVAVEKDADMSLIGDTLNISGGGTIEFESVPSLQITGGPSDNRFTISGWTGTAATTLDGSGGNDWLVIERDADIVLADDLLQTSDGVSVTIADVERAEVTGGLGDNRFDLSSWTGTATLDGVGGTNSLIFQRNADFILDHAQPWHVGTSDGALEAYGFQNVELTGGPGDNRFILNRWEGEVTLDGSGGNDRLIAEFFGDFTLGSDLLEHFYFSIAFADIEEAELIGNFPDDNTFVVNDFIGPLTLGGNSRDDLFDLSIPDFQTAVVHGGLGYDTLRLRGSGTTLDLTAIPDGRLTGIDAIDFAGDTPSTLTLDWETLKEVTTNDSLVVRGDTGSHVNMDPDWALYWHEMIDGEPYYVFRHDSTDLLKVSSNMSTSWPMRLQLHSLLPANGGDGTRGLLISGDSVGQINSAGDVNGDGLDDLLIGAPYVDSNGKQDSGQSYVVFGRADGFPAELEILALDGANGFAINGINEGDRSGSSVSSAGDVNGDGFDDLLIGADTAGPNGQLSGQSYVVFGRASGFPAELELSELNGANGFAINGVNQLDRSGDSVSSAGDVNGDGFDDILIGALTADPNDKYASGQSYVVFGRAGGFAAELELSALDGANGFAINGVDEQDCSGTSVSSAGDVNGDGFDDLLIGADGADPNGNLSAGETYLVFGRADGFPAELELSALDGADGLVFRGIDGEDFSGRSVSSAGDVNGDGLDDLLIGAFWADPNGNPYAGESYLVFGRPGGFPAELELSTLDGSNGFVINGIAVDDRSGSSVSSAGDVNGDGFDDLLIGAPGEPYQRESYVVFGRASGFGDTLELSALDGVNGFVVEGPNAGAAVNSADVNGDGFDDLLMGCYVLFGGEILGAVTIAETGDAGDNTLTGTVADDVLIGGQGNDLLVGAGGQDVLRGGQGDDVLAVPESGFRRLVGGSGSDALRLDGSGLVLDLTAVADNRITGVETIDVTGIGPNTLILNVLEVLNLSDTSNTLVVRGDGDDYVDLGPGWTYSGVQMLDDVHFTVLTQGAATLLVDRTVAISECNYAINGTAFYDLDGDEDWDKETEPGIANWKIYLDENQNGQWDEGAPGEPFDITDGNGKYSFTELSAGTYVVAEVMPNGWESGTAGSQTVVRALELIPQDVDFDNRFTGEFGAICGSKFYDANGDGTWDKDTEPGVVNGTIYVDSNLNGQWDTTEPHDVTDADGGYCLTEIPAGIHAVNEMPQVGWMPMSSVSRTVLVAPGQTVEGIDFTNEQPLGPLSYSGDDGSNRLTLHRNGDRLEILDTSNGTVLARRLISRTTSVEVFGNGGDDILTVDFSNGEIIEALIEFEAGTGDDSLVFIGTPLPIMGHTPFGDGRGRAYFNPANLGHHVIYTELEAVDTTGIAVAEIQYYELSSAAEIVLDDFGVPDDGFSQIRTVGGAFRGVSFANPSDRLQIEAYGTYLVGFETVDSGFSPAEMAFVGISTSIFRLVDPGAIPDTTSVVLVSDPTFDLNGIDETIGSLAGVGRVALGTGTLTTGGNSRSTAFDGVFEGAGGLNKVGTGTFSFNGAIEYTGPTNVNEGTLGGSGYVRGPITVDSGGSVAPGSDLASVFSVGSIEFRADSMFVVELNGATPIGGCDQMIVSEAVDLGDAVLDPSLGFTPNSGDTLTIIDNIGSEQVVGSFKGLAEGAFLLIDGLPFSITYVGGDGNDVVLTALPQMVNLAAGGQNAEIFVSSSDLVIRQQGQPDVTNPLGSITGLVINGSADEETIFVNIDGMSSAELPSGLWILGGEGIDDNDILQIDGPTTEVVEYGYHTTGSESGTIVMDDLAIHFYEFEPIIDRLSVVNRSFTIGTSGAQIVQLGDSAADPGMSTIESGDAEALFESLTFTNPTGTFEINAGDGDDTIVIEPLDPAWLAALSVYGQQGGDTIDASALDWPITLIGGLGADDLRGGAGNDSLIGGDGDDTLTGGPGSDELQAGEGSNRVTSDLDDTVTISEGDTFDFSAVFVNPETATIDWNDGNEPETAGMAPETGTVSGSHVYADEGTFAARLTVIDDGGHSTDHTLTVVVLPKPRIVGRHVFYNHSAFDGSLDADADDDRAIDRAKSPLLPGQTAASANYTNYSRGINGIMIDVVRLLNVPTVEDFVFRVGNDGDPAGWTVLVDASIRMAVREGAGDDGSDRVTVVWDDGVIQNEWLEVTVLANEHMALPIDDVFYFGNAVGDTGNSETDTLVNAADVIAIRDNPRGLSNPASIDNPYDLNRDAAVDAIDLILARNNATSPLSALRLIELAQPAAPAPMGEAESTFATGRLDSATAPSVASLDGLMAAQADQPVVDTMSPSATLSKLLRRLGSTSN